MEEWKVAKDESISWIFYVLLLLQFATLLLCCYGFLKEIRPSEPFLTDYLLGISSGITQVEHRGLVQLQIWAQNLSMYRVHKAEPKKMDFELNVLHARSYGQN